jgi:rare lipoprotein A
MKSFFGAMALVLALASSVRAETCRASYYGAESGTHTANGERFVPSGLTAAHRSLPFGTRLRVAYGGRSVDVRINDRGPAKHLGRCLDLSHGAARAIGLDRVGVGLITFDRRP